MTIKSYAALTTEIGSQLPDNTVGAITPSALRTVFQDILDSATQTVNVVQQSFTTSGTYTPNAKMIAALLETWGGGAGAGGAANSAIGQSTGGFGGSGGYSRKLVTASAIGASKAVTIGAFGAGGAAGNNNGTAGGDTSVGSLCIAKGGSPGVGAAANSNGAGGVGGILGTGDETQVGNTGDTGAFSSESTVVIPFGSGGWTSLGRGGLPGTAPTNANSGAGGGGGLSINNNGDQAGGNGANGFCRITEFLGCS